MTSSDSRAIMLLRRSVLVLLVVFGRLSSSSANDRPVFADRLDQQVEAECDRQQIVGAAVGVIQDNRIAYLAGYGYANREEKEPVTLDTLFRWASISKPITAVCAMQLWESGRLDLDADVRRYVPEFPEKGASITSRQLLCHQSGIVHYTNGKVVRTRRRYTEDHPFRDVVLALDTFMESPLVAAPGERFSYTTHGYILLSAVVERAGGRAFAEQVAERIAKPIGLSTLQPDYQWVDLPNRTIGYRKRAGMVVRTTDTDVSWKLGGGGFVSNVGDMARFALAVMRNELVDAETATAMYRRQGTQAGRQTGYGLGFAITTDESGRQLVGHSGAQEKTRTHMIFSPELGDGVVVLCNSEHAEPRKLAGIVLNILADERAPRLQPVGEPVR